MTSAAVEGDDGMARFGEEEKWIAFFDADAGVERARFNVLRQTGEIIAALR